MSALIESETRYPGLPTRCLTPKDLAVAEIMGRLPSFVTGNRDDIAFLMRQAYSAGFTAGVDALADDIQRLPR